MGKIKGNFRVPLDKPQPDFEDFLSVLIGKRKPKRPLIMEYLIDEEVRQYIGENLLGQKWVNFDPSSKEKKEKYLLNFIDFWYRMGYDYVRYEENVGFTGKWLLADDPSQLSRGNAGG